MTAASHDAFALSRAGFEALAAWLGGGEADGLEHAELEHRLTTDGRDLLRQLLQDHLDLRASRERRCDVVDADGDAHTRVEGGHERGLATVVGEVRVRRLAYRWPGHANLHPADAALNLPTERHSHGLRRLAAVESTRGSFEEAAGAVARATGTHVGKRQVEELAAASAADVDAFYATSSGSRRTTATCWSSRPTARASSCAPARCARPPSGRRPQPPPSSKDACPRARSPTASVWPPSAPSTTSRPPPAAPPTCWGPGTARASRCRPGPGRSG